MTAKGAGTVRSPIRDVAVTEAELDAMVERYQRYPGALAVDYWKFYQHLLDEVERAEHPDIVDGHSRVWRWFRSSAWANANDPYYSHCAAVATADEIPFWGFPHPRLADNPNYVLCEICKRDWPEAAKAEYGIWRDGCLWPDRVLPGQMAKAIELRAQGLFAPYDARFARLVRRHGDEWADVSADDF